MIIVVARANGWTLGGFVRNARVALGGSFGTDSFDVWTLRCGFLREEFAKILEAVACAFIFALHGVWRNLLLAEFLLWGRLEFKDRFLIGRLCASPFAGGAARVR